AGRARKARHALKRHLDAFDDLRDTQVQLLIIGRMRRSFSAARLFHDYLREREQRFARSSRQNIRHVKTGRFAAVTADSRREVKARRKQQSARQTSALLLRSVNRAFARTLALCRRIDPRRTLTIHRTRIAFKRFRYMVEVLAGSLPAANKKLIGR